MHTPKTHKLKDGWWMVYGRSRKPLLKKLNPWWWLLNDDDPVPPDWYPHGKFMWWLRNPCHNLTFYVLGVADRAYDIYGKEPVIEGPAPGCKWHVIRTVIRRPYFACQYPLCGRMFVFYIGWRWDGPLGLKLNWKR